MQRTYNLGYTLPKSRPRNLKKLWRYVESSIMTVSQREEDTMRKMEKVSLA